GLLPDGETVVRVPSYGVHRCTPKSSVSGSRSRPAEPSSPRVPVRGSLRKSSAAATKEDRAGDGGVFSFVVRHRVEGRMRAPGADGGVHLLGCGLRRNLFALLPGSGVDTPD